LEIAAGEIVGIAGVDGNGQGELIEAIAGVRRPVRGSIRLVSGSPGSLAVIPENRDIDSLVLDMPLWQNVMLAGGLLAGARGRFGWVGSSRARTRCAALLENYGIRAPAGARTLASELSGGNRQRFCVARALESQPRAIIAHNVTRGLDVAATAAVRRMLAGFAAGGGALLLISSDLDELQALCGRIAVLNRGRLRDVSPEERNAVRLGLLMAG
jgi:simple sugar transport system ATP-binding protein